MRGVAASRAKVARRFERAKRLGQVEDSLRAQKNRTGQTAIGGSGGVCNENIIALDVNGIIGIRITATVEEGGGGGDEYDGGSGSDRDSSDSSESSESSESSWVSPISGEGREEGRVGGGGVAASTFAATHEALTAERRALKVAALRRITLASVEIEQRAVESTTEGRAVKELERLHRASLARLTSGLSGPSPLEVLTQEGQGLRRHHNYKAIPPHAALAKFFTLPSLV